MSNKVNLLENSDGSKEHRLRVYSHKETIRILCSNDRKDMDNISSQVKNTLLMIISTSYTKLQKDGLILLVIK